MEEQVLSLELMLNRSPSLFDNSIQRSADAIACCFPPLPIKPSSVSSHSCNSGFWQPSSTQPHQQTNSKKPQLQSIEVEGADPGSPPAPERQPEEPAQTQHPPGTDATHTLDPAQLLNKRPPRSSIASVETQRKVGRVSFDLVGGGLFDTFATSEYDRSGEFNPDKSHQEWILEEVRRAVNRLHGNTNCPWVYKSTPPHPPFFHRLFDPALTLSFSLSLSNPFFFASLCLCLLFLVVIAAAAASAASAAGLARVSEMRSCACCMTVGTTLNPSSRRAKSALSDSSTSARRRRRKEYSGRKRSESGSGGGR